MNIRIFTGREMFNLIIIILYGLNSFMLILTRLVVAIVV